MAESIFDVGLGAEPRAKKRRTGAPPAPGPDEAALYQWVQGLMQPLIDYDKSMKRKLSKQVVRRSTLPAPLVVACAIVV